MQHVLKVRNLDAGYGKTQILRGVSLDVAGGEIVTLIGANGAGKTTLLMAVCGILKPMAGSVEFNGTRIDRLPPHRIVSLGIAQVPQGRQLFATLTVLENLEVAASVGRDVKKRRQRLSEVFEYFPVLKERQGQRAGTLSGGQQQLVAIGRALMTNPSLLILDEPSSGLSPLLVESLGETIIRLRRDHSLTVLLVEQNAHLALDIADRGYVLQSGHIVLGDRASALANSEVVRKAYLGA